MTIEDAIRDRFRVWNEALQSGDPDAVTRLYAEDAILLPTVSNRVRHDHAEIRDYFVQFLAKGPSGTIEESNVRLFGDVAIDSGVYLFALADGARVRARYTFVYHHRGDGWAIVEHHSSAMPEG